VLQLPKADGESRLSSLQSQALLGVQSAAAALAEGAGVSNAAKFDWAYDQAKRWIAENVGIVNTHRVLNLASMIRRASRRNATLQFRRRKANDPRDPLVRAALAFAADPEIQESNESLRGTRSASAPADFMNFMDAVDEYKKQIARRKRGSR
jgi:hypothetical protein